jgi:phosphoribosylformimino-5-aminoimidazole carboxamide ribonucleotide (ProFAR) isomerase
VFAYAKETCRTVRSFQMTPVAMAQQWHAQGARRLHLVDLDGAFAGKPVNAPIIERIAKGVTRTSDSDRGRYS